MIKNLLLCALTPIVLLSSHSQAAEKTVETAVFTDKEMLTAAWLRDAARNDNLSYRILESLTTEVGPRMAGSPADARAVAWAEAKFKELGFDKVWK
ncbi:MAG: peptidase M28 family protein, partial [Pseudomonadota bacterium]